MVLMLFPIEIDKLLIFHIILSKRQFYLNFNITMNHLDLLWQDFILVANIQHWQFIVLCYYAFEVLKKIKY